MKYPPANAHNPIHCRALTVMSRESSVMSPPVRQFGIAEGVSLGHHSVVTTLRSRPLPSSPTIDVDAIAEMADRCVRPMRDWLSSWRIIRLHLMAAELTGNENAATLTQLITPR